MTMREAGHRSHGDRRHVAGALVHGPARAHGERPDPVTADACTARIVDPGRVAGVRAALPEAGQVTDLADVFSLLADPGRLRLLLALLEGGELCVCDLAATCGMGESAVSHALRLLRAHRVVTVSRRGRMAFYRLEDAHVRMLLDLALTHAGHAVPSHPERDPAAQPGR